MFNYFGFDCVTLSPYLGVDSIDPFISSSKKGVFILCRNFKSFCMEFQDKKIKNEAALYESVAMWANSLNKKENIGLVIGATALSELSMKKEI